MGNILKVGVSWTPQGIDKTLKTKFSVGVGGLPTRIEVTKLPNKIDYVDGETINPSGIIVHAYYADGTDYGTVLNSELTFEPMTVNVGGSEYYTKNGVPTYAVKHSYYHVYSYWFSWRDVYAPQNCIADGNMFSLMSGEGYLLFTKYNGRIYFADKDANYTNAYGGTAPEQPSGVNGYTSISYGEPSGVGTVPFRRANELNWSPWLLSAIPESSIDPLTVDYSDPEPSGFLITVKWNRPADGQTLTTTFSVNVSESA